MTWNHRVCKSTYVSPSGITHTNYEIREVYYTDTGEIFAVTEDAVGVYADSDETEPRTEEEILAEMQKVMDRFSRALKYPIIDLDTIKFAPMP